MFWEGTGLLVFMGVSLNAVRDGGLTITHHGCRPLLALMYVAEDYK